MSLFDIILLCIIGGFALFGLWFGFMHTLGSLLGTFLGIFLAFRYYPWLGGLLMKWTGWEGNIANVVMFILAFLIINRLVGIFFWLVGKSTDVVTKLPLIGSLNRILGLALGFFEGVVTVGVILYFVEQYPVSEKLVAAIATSQVAPYTIGTAAILLPMVPIALKALDKAAGVVESKVL